MALSVFPLPLPSALLEKGLKHRFFTRFGLKTSHELVEMFFGHGSKDKTTVLLHPVRRCSLLQTELLP
jgi:hypothetical protein